MFLWRRFQFVSTSNEEKLNQLKNMPHYMCKRFKSESFATH